MARSAVSRAVPTRVAISVKTSNIAWPASMIPWITFLTKASVFATAASSAPLTMSKIFSPARSSAFARLAIWATVKLTAATSAFAIDSDRVLDRVDDRVDGLLDGVHDVADGLDDRGVVRVVGDRPRLDRGAELGEVEEHLANRLRGRACPRR